MIGMEYFPNGSLDRLVVNRNGSLMEEKVFLFLNLVNSVQCKANFTRNEQFTK